MEIGLCSPGKASCDRVALPNLRTVHAGCLSVSIIHRTLTWTTGSLTCTQMLMHAIAHGERTYTVRESALKVDSGRNIPCRTGESNLRQRRAGPMFYQMSYIPARRTKDLPHRTETSSISLSSRGHRFCFYFVLKLIHSASCQFCLLLFTISLNSDTHSQPVACATVFLHTH